LATGFKESGKLKYALKEEGELAAFFEKNLHDFNYTDEPKKVEFWQGDPHNLKPYFDGYDLVLANDILDTLYDPKLFLRTIAERIVSGGYLVIASSFDWDENKTPREKWLGGFKKNGEKYSTFEALKELLSGEFEPIDEPCELQSIWYENKRKTTIKALHVSVWQKK
jgi:putative 4-mercaptohistidine N1-methyltranferase